MGFFMAFFKSLPPLSALLNSLATFIGMPTFLANSLECAAAAMRRACFADLLGILYTPRMNDDSEKELALTIFESMLARLVTELRPDGLSPVDPAHTTMDEIVKYFSSYLDDSK